MDLYEVGEVVGDDDRMQREYQCEIIEPPGRDYAGGF